MKSSDTSAVHIDDLTKVFLSRDGRGVHALQNIDLDVRSGEVVAIIGPSGCGKSSLLRILAGLDQVYEGRVRWNLAAAEGNDKSRRGRLTSATVFQSDSTLPWMTVEKNVRIGFAKLRLDRADAAARVADVLQLVGLSEFPKAYPHELSGGMRQRVAIARALATRPHLLLMDEPLAALDAQTRLVMQQELIDIWRQTHSTVFYVTHDIEEAVTVADRVVVLSARPGRVRMVRDVETTGASVTELRRDPAFGDLTVELWNTIAGEVGGSLAAAPNGEPGSTKVGVA
ncbi:ABC transporter ATP-binding protein [Qaidamihabitans albus]|uniref:ABC transporter ATP-binding protein n=1 Tax=Qaidamihabitans albus TaxID=2795733 RepID=UPI0018F1AB16|nr:ABC transporter ATP-binding protein [Qaidamihabitans albus]